MIAGGEKRRLSIACELLEEPQLMFLDEPTTGLDSTNAAKVVDILSSLTESGITIMMTIHQPRSSFFTMIKRILMLSGNGQVCSCFSFPLLVVQDGKFPDAPPGNPLLRNQMN